MIQRRFSSPEGALQRRIAKTPPQRNSKKAKSNARDEIGPAREINQLSGRQLIIPNSLFLANPVQNQSLQQKYVLQTVRFTVFAGEDWKALEKLLLDSANKECAPFLEGARHSMVRLSVREGLDLPRVEPRVSFQYDDSGRLHATLRFPTPLDRVSRTEQAIIRSVLEARGVPQTIGTV